MDQNSFLQSENRLLQAEVSGLQDENFRLQRLLDDYQAVEKARHLQGLPFINPDFLMDG